MNTIELDNTYVAHSYGRFPLEIVYGHGSMVRDAQGFEYIDLGTGIAVNTFGLTDKPWIDAVTAQLNVFQHTSNLYYQHPCAQLAKVLCERTGMKKVFFNNSGAEANEAAIKAARRYAAERKGPDYFTIITLENSFHGRTITTLAATGQDHFHQLFTPLTEGFVSTPINDCAALDAAVAANKVAGIMIECVQGEGGVHVLDPAFVAHIADVCASQDIIFMVDEVQTGNGRSGALYSYMNFGADGQLHYPEGSAAGAFSGVPEGCVKPDVVTTAKGLAGGLPIGACMLGEKVQDIFGPGDNGSTFGGNPVACTGALSILSRMDDACLAGVRSRSAAIFQALEGAPGVEEVSGMGLLVGIKPVKPASQVIATCMTNGVLCLSAKDKVRLLPALNIPEDELAKALQVIKDACAE